MSIVVSVTLPVKTVSNILLVVVTFKRRSIASAVPGRHQYTDNIYQEATSELST